MESNRVNEMIDDIMRTTWYSLNEKGELTQGTKGNWDALYKAEDILKICDKYKSED